MSRSRTTARFWAALTGVSMVSALGLGVATSANAVDTPAEKSPTSDALTSVGSESFEDGTYLVILKDQAAASYEGGIDGLAPTKPAEGERFDARSPEAQAFAAAAKQKQEIVADEAGVKPIDHFTTTMNGFTAELTAEQALELAMQKDVFHLVAEEMLHLDTVSSPEFLGLTGGKGMWRQYGTPRRAGEGVVVGIIDSGISPQNPSFAGRKLKSKEQTRVNRVWMSEDGSTHMLKNDGNMWHGECVTGEDWTLSDCNDKIIGARYYNSHTDEELGEGAIKSARDAGGHGTHTASTAAGNFGVPMYIGGEFFGRGSGMAPAAKIAAYKVCWEMSDPDSGGCSNTDSYRAIEDAVNDGVDVLNFSISGSRDNEFDAVDLQFMNAANAGVFVAASAGNSGPTASTVAHNAPWMTTVAASAFSGRYGTVTMGNGEKVFGASLVQEPTGPLPAVMSTAVKTEGASEEDAAICLADTLDAAKAAGKLVVCDRGQTARVAKSAEVDRVGGAAMILRNVTAGSLSADDHAVPSVHVNVETGILVGEYVTSAENPTIELSPGNTSGTPSPALPYVAGFSSRGPALAAEGNLLKPDIGAPGQDVLAATAPSHGSDYQFMSGTSMSSPHIAGLAGLIYGKYPHWSPATMKSAMMTTARDHKLADGSVDNDHFAGGAGFVDPTEFYKPGLVYDAGKADWDAYLMGQDPERAVLSGDYVANVSPDVEPIRAVDLNVPSFAVSQISKTETVTRSVTSMQAGTWTATADVPGFDVKVEPSTLSFDKAGETKDFTVTFIRNGAPLNEYAHGWLTWGGPTEVRSPISLKAVALKAPLTVEAPVAAGELSYDIKPGDTANIPVEIDGMVAATVETGEVAQGPAAIFDENSSSKHFDFVVEEGTTQARLDLLAGEGAKDLDLFIVDMDNFQFVPSQSAGATSGASESITIENPAPGNYRAIVNGYETKDAEAVPFTLERYILDGTNNGKLTVDPNPIDAVEGVTKEVTLTWDTEAVSGPQLAVLTYGDTGVSTLVKLS